MLSLGQELLHDAIKQQERQDIQTVLKLAQKNNKELRA